MSRLIALPAPSDDRAAVPPVASLHNAVADARRRHRPLIAAAGAWALSRGVPLPADHIALWAAVVEDGGYSSTADGINGPWRASHIAGFLETIAAWCALAGCSPPVHLAESLWHLYGFLAATGRLHPESDALTELRAAVVVFCAIDDLPVISPPPPEPTAA